jgi:hypothetical protein
MKLPDATVILGEPTDPPQEGFAFKSGTPEPFLDDAVNFRARDVQVRPAERLIKVVDTGKRIRHLRLSRLSDLDRPELCGFLRQGGGSPVSDGRIDARQTT